MKEGVHPEIQGSGILRLETRPRCKLPHPFPWTPTPGPGSHLPTEALAGVRDGLGGHECRGAGRAGQLGVVPLELVADTEVGDLHVPVVPQEQVGRLDVPVHDLLAVHCGERQLEPEPAAPPGKPVSRQRRRRPHTLLSGGPQKRTPGPSALLCREGTEAGPGGPDLGLDS